MHGQPNELYKIVPATPQGWIKEGESTIYNKETLYDYIDGGAELYISYGMDSVISTLYTKEGIGEIRVEIFDMHNAENAFGVFSHTRTRDEKEYGNGSQYFTGALIFWKGNYYISVMADDENDEIKNAITELAKDTEEKINVNGSIPDIISFLPKENLIQDGFIYFHHYIWLNSYYFLSNENILNIDQNCHAVIGKYNVDKQRQYLLIVQYTDADKAMNAFISFRKHFLDDSLKTNTVNIEDETWVTGKQTGNFLIGVFNSPSKASAEGLLMKTEKNLK